LPIYGEIKIRELTQKESMKSIMVTHRIPGLRANTTFNLKTKDGKTVVTRVTDPLGPVASFLIHLPGIRPSNEYRNKTLRRLKKVIGDQQDK